MALTDVIAPPALSFERNTIVFGDLNAQVKFILDYKPEVDEAWLAKIANMPGVILSMHMSHMEPVKLLKDLNSSIQEYTSRLAAGGDALNKSRWSQSIKNSEILLKKIDQESQKVYQTVIGILIIAENQDELARKSREVEAACAAAGMRLRTIVFKQENGLKAIAPFGILPEGIKEFAAREMLAETIAASFPWVSFGINHGKGTVIGRDTAGGLVLVDRWNPPEDSGVTNPNMNILGGSGGGKSFAAKLMLLREYALGARILIIDPEREYRRMCRKVEGSWINAAGGHGKINPFEISPVPDIDSDEEEDEQNFQGMGPLAIHIQKLKTFFQLYLPSIDDLEMAELEDAIIEVYKDCGITWDTEEITDIETWPTIGDLKKYIKSERLKVLIRSAIEGADSFLWNGQTTIPAIGDFTVFDIRDLTDASDTVRRAQYFNILRYTWDLVREGKATGKRTILVVDEAWILADPNTPQALNTLRDFSKRIRKYDGSLVIVTQNIIDFLAPELARLGQPVISNASQKLLMRQEDKDLEALQSLLNLSEAEVDLLSNAKRGEGLYIAGNQRVHIKIEASPYEAEVIE